MGSSARRGIKIAREATREQTVGFYRIVFFIDGYNMDSHTTPGREHKKYTTRMASGFTSLLNKKIFAKSSSLVAY